MSRITDRNDWKEVWKSDKQGILDAMIHNLASDLEAGYDYFGVIISNQINQIEAYKINLVNQLEAFSGMDDAAVNRWCYYDLVTRGAID